MSLNINKTCVGACATHIKACLIIEMFRDWFIFKTKQQRTLLNSTKQSKTHLQHFLVVALVCHTSVFSFTSFTLYTPTPQNG